MLLIKNLFYLKEKRKKREEREEDLLFNLDNLLIVDLLKKLNKRLISKLHIKIKVLKNLNYYL